MRVTEVEGYSLFKRWKTGYLNVDQIFDNLFSLPRSDLTCC